MPQKNPAKDENFLSQSLRASKIALRSSFIFSFFSNLLLLLIPIYSMQVLDRVISSGSMETLAMLTGVTILGILCYALISASRQAMMLRISCWLDKTTAPIIFTRMIESSAQGKKGEGMQAMEDFSTIKTFISGPVLASLIDAPWSVIFMAVLFFIHPLIGSVALASGLVLFTLAIFNEFSTKPLAGNASAFSHKAAKHVDASGRNAEAIEAMGMVENVRKSWGRQNMASSLLQLKAGNIGLIFSASSKFLRTITQIAVTGCGAYLVLKHEISTGGIIAASIISGKALSPFESAISSWKNVIAFRKAMERLGMALDEAPRRVENINLPTPTGKVVFDNVYYAPQGSTKATIRGISFQIEAGEVLGVIGASAAGKSTLAKLFTGILKPNAGAVRMDGADVYSWKRSNFGQHVGYLPQDVELFAGTIKDNIARMDKNASDAVVVKAAQYSNAHNMILALADGYNTEIGEGGARISAGQRQRIGLARAFYGNPKLIVLDEPNSNLDADGEIALAQAIANARKNGSTLVLISHKPSIISLVDKVLVMQEGLISAFGTRDAILGKVAAKNFAKPKSEQRSESKAKHQAYK